MMHTGHFAKIPFAIMTTDRLDGRVIEMALPALRQRCIHSSNTRRREVSSPKTTRLCQTALALCSSPAIEIITPEEAAPPPGCSCSGRDCVDQGLGSCLGPVAGCHGAAGIEQTMDDASTRIASTNASRNGICHRFIMVYDQNGGSDRLAADVVTNQVLWLW